MEKVRLGFLSIIVFFLLGLPDLNAQWNYSFSVQHEYDSNPFRLPEAEDEFASIFDLGLGKVLGEFTLLYYGSYSMFTKSVDRNYYWHQLGFYREAENSMLGFYAENRINKTEYNMYNYYDLTVYYKHRIISEFVIPTFNISSTYKKYNNLSKYDNIFLSGSVSLNKSFQTKTTFILSSSLNYKNYFNSSGQVLVVESVEDSDINHMGQGRRWFIRRNSANDVNVSRQDISAVINTQLFNNIRLAQSLFEKTGMAVYFANRTLLGNKGVFDEDIEYNRGDESDLYDDPVSRNENALGIDLTQLLPLGFTLKSGYQYSWRNYPNQGSYINSSDYDTAIQRADERGTLYINLNKSFLLSEENGVSLKTSLYFEAMNNESNSYWYNYTGNQVSLNLSIEF